MTRMKLVVIFALALLLAQCVGANAGEVHIGLLNEDDFGDWKCGAPVPSEGGQAKTRCGVAKYGETVPCPTLVVTNDSRETVSAQIQLTGIGFEKPPSAGFPGVIFQFGEAGRFSTRGKCRYRTIDHLCESLAPGHSCSAEIDFSPERSGVSHGHLEVLVSSSGAPLSKSYDLTATGNYPPELKAIDEVIQRHRDGLMDIPHVVRVAISDFHDNAIQVEVAHEEDIPKVERRVPTKLEGYPVEVIEQIRRGWGF